MAGVNKVILIGNLGKDPEVRSFEGGAKVAQFSIATSESWQDKTSGEWKEETQWHNIVAWRHLAERAEKYLKKGSRVYVEGKLTNRSYDKDGQTRYITEVVATSLMLLDPKPEGQASTPPPPPQPQAVGNENTDDLPF